MYKDSPFARPVGSFRKPAPIVEVDPDDNPDFTVCFRREYVPYILGSLQQLVLQSTWATDDPDVLNLMQSRAQLLMSMFIAGCPDLPAIELIGVLDGDIELTSLCENLRFNNGKFQALCCGVWTDIQGQPVNGFFGTQPGNGTPQPAAGGGCVIYHAQIQGQGIWYLPTIVNTNDTIVLTNVAGATYNPVTGSWACPDGNLFFAGACVDQNVTSGTNPMPAVKSGKLIAKIGATYYDVQGAGFTVPAGIVAQPVTFLFNYTTPSGSGGTVNFDVQICNNQGAVWTLNENLAATPGHYVVRGSPFVATVSQWSASNGWQSIACVNALGGAGRYNMVQVEQTFAHPVTLKHFEMSFDAVVGARADGQNQQVYAYQGATLNTIINSAPVTGNGQFLSWDGTVTSVTKVGIVLVGANRSDATCPPSGSATLKATLMSGVGTLPY